MVLSIRKATLADEASMSYICLATGNAGKSAEGLFKNEEVLGDIFAVPYLYLPTAFQFVLVDKDDTSSNDESPQEKIVGYVVGSTDRRAYEKDAVDNWWPKIQAKYHQPTEEDKGQYTDVELFFLDILAKPDWHTAEQAMVDVYTAFLHINILEPYRGKGWGTRLIRTAAETVRKAGGKGLWVHPDPRNIKSHRFYLAIGFEEMDGPAKGYYALDTEKVLNSSKGLAK